MKPLAPLIVAALAMAGPLTSHAQGITTTVANYREAKGNTKMSGNLVFYLLGVESGFQATNALLRAKNQTRLYCQPGKLGLNEILLESMIDKELQEPTNPAHYQYADSDAISVVLLQAMVSTFPCP